MGTEQIEALKQVFQKMIQPIKEWVERIVAVARNVIRQIVAWYKPIRHRLLYVRSHGTHQQRRAVWKLLNPPKMRKLRTRITYGR